MAKSSDITPKLLQKILGAIETTNEGLEVLREDTTRRLDLLAESSMRTNTELVELKGQVASLNDKVEKLDRTVERNGERFEHALITQGASHRELESRVARLEAHVGIE